MGCLDALSRIPKILESNINALLDKCEDPAKMIDQCLIDCKKDVAELQRALTELTADYKMAKNDLKETDEKIARKKKAAENALKAGDEEAARQLIKEKQTLEEARTTMQSNYDTLAVNVAKLTEAYNKRVEDVKGLEARKDAAKTKIKLAETQDKLNDMTDKALSNKASAAFDKYERQAEKKLAAAEARSELNSNSSSNLEDKYLGGAGGTVDDELAAMKASLGL